VLTLVVIPLLYFSVYANTHPEPVVQADTTTEPTS
jgi:hypothetical protein